MKPNPGEDANGPEAKAFEAQLAALVPRGDRLDRDRLMYLAGQASAESAPAASPAARIRWTLSASLGAAFGATAAALVMMAISPPAMPAAPAGQDTPRSPVAFAAVRGDAAPGGMPAWQFQSLFDVEGRVDAQLSAAGFVFSDARRNLGGGGEPVADLDPHRGQPPLTSRSYDEALRTLLPADRS